MVIGFIDDHRERFGVARICRFLAGHDVPMAESTYYASKTRPRSARSQRDEVVFDHIVRESLAIPLPVPVRDTPDLRTARNTNDSRGARNGWYEP